METILTIVLIMAIFIGVPVLILWLRDRGGFFGAALNKIIGLLAAFIGLSIIAWIIYNLFFPTKEFTESVHGPGLLIFRIATPFVMAWYGWRWLTNEGPGIEDTPMDFNCEELKASVYKARATLPWFVEQVERKVESAHIKFPLKTQNDVIEHVWGYVHAFQNDIFKVTISNELIDSDREISDRRDVHINEVEDWQIVFPDGHMKGAYSVIALFEHYESIGKKLSKKMKKQKSLLIDAEYLRRT